MILIADSGATKTDWRIVKDKDNIFQAVTEGVNPHYATTDKILSIFTEAIAKKELPGEVESIYFYGAGITSGNKASEISGALNKAFKTSGVEVQTDIVGVARSLCGNRSGIIALLGTGSASCVYDGKKITKQVPSLGYILGDEGSGAHLGKKLLAGFLRGSLPRELEKKFKEQFKIDKEYVLNELNKGRVPSRFLGSFTEFILPHIHFPYMHSLVYNSFAEFIENYIMPYSEHTELKVSFCGGVAFHFSNVLTKACSDFKLSLGKVVKSPIAGLTLYHLES